MSEASDNVAEHPAETPEAETGETPTLTATVEAILMTVDKPIAAKRIAEVAGVDGAGAVNEAVEQLNRFYDAHGSSFRIEAVAGGYQVLTRAPFRDVLAQLHRTRSEGKLSPAALETLAIVAYKQPVLRTTIESIRGAASGEVLRALMDRNLVKIVGRAEEIGRPMLYGTTKHFLEVFGLASLKDLPKAEELQKP
jgi:segregation and condensation protein B